MSVSLRMDELEVEGGEEGTPAVNGAREGKDGAQASTSRSTGSTLPPTAKHLAEQFAEKREEGGRSRRTWKYVSGLIGRTLLGSLEEQYSIVVTIPCRLR
jgi:hypothetical protein